MLEKQTFTVLSILETLRASKRRYQLSKRFFQPGVPNDGHGGGRRTGARNKLQTTLLEELAADFEQHGAGVIRICRVEKPVEYLKVAASLLPKEFEITETQLMQIPDEELDAFIQFARRRIAERALSLDGREDETLN